MILQAHNMSEVKSKVLDVVMRTSMWNYKEEINFQKYKYTINFQYKYYLQKMIACI